MHIGSFAWGEQSRPSCSRSYLEEAGPGAGREAALLALKADCSAQGLLGQCLGCLGTGTELFEGERTTVSPDAPLRATKPARSSFNSSSESELFIAKKVRRIQPRSKSLASYNRNFDQPAGSSIAPLRVSLRLPNRRFTVARHSRSNAQAAGRGEISFHPVNSVRWCTALAIHGICLVVGEQYPIYIAK